MFELILATLRNLDANKQGIFGFEMLKGGESFIDEYFRGETSEDYSKEHCTFGLPIPMKHLIENITSSEGSSKILESFVSNRIDNGNTFPVYTSLSQRYLVVKLDFKGVELTQGNIQSLWTAVDHHFDTDLLTQPGDEEHKSSKENAVLVAFIDRLNKDSSTNNNEVNILIDGKWRNFKTCIYKFNSLDHIIED